MRDWWPVQQRSVIQSAASVHSGGQNIQSPLLTTSTSLCAQQARLEYPTSTRLVSQSVYAPGGCPDIHLRWPANVSDETRSRRKFASYYQDMQNTPSAQQCLWFSLLSSNLHLATPLVRPWREQTALSPCARRKPCHPSLARSHGQISAVVAHSLGLAAYTSCTQPACS